MKYITQVAHISMVTSIQPSQDLFRNVRQMYSRWITTILILYLQYRSHSLINSIHAISQTCTEMIGPPLLYNNGRIFGRRTLIHRVTAFR